MRVFVHQTHYYDWEPVPADVKLTPADLKSGKVKPNARNDGHLMQVTKQLKDKDGNPALTHTMLALTEAGIIAHIIFRATPNQGHKILSRSEAIADLTSRIFYAQHGHRSHVLGFEVDCDQGPDEALFRAMLQPHTESKHPVSGQPTIAPSEIEERVAAYLLPATSDQHIASLHAAFAVKPTGWKPPPPNPSSAATTAAQVTQ